jgi:hypothetical protein
MGPLQDGCDCYTSEMLKEYRQRAHQRTTRRIWKETAVATLSGALKASQGTDTPLASQGPALSMSLGPRKSAVAVAVSNTHEVNSGEVEEVHGKNQDGLELNQGPLLCINRFNSLNLLV